MVAEMLASPVVRVFTAALLVVLVVGKGAVDYLCRCAATGLLTLVAGEASSANDGGEAAVVVVASR